MQKLRSVFAIPELRQKIFITLLFLAIYRIGFYIPLPFVDQEKMAEKRGGGGGALGQFLGFVSMLGGATLPAGTFFALAIIPYIPASIFFHLLAAVSPPLEKLQKE